jgi:O-antigen/teichoic acid export membrane protein
MKRKIVNLLPESSFAKGVSVLLGGSAAAQLLTVIAAPLLTRLYTPEDFGVLAVFAGLLGILGALSTFYYFLAIPIPEDDSEAANIVVLCLLLLLGVTGVTALASVFLAKSVAVTLGVPTLEAYFWLLPVGVLLSGVYSIFSYWAIRTKRFSRIAATSLKQAVASLAIQIAGFKVGAGALILGQTVGQGVGGVSLANMGLRNPAFRKITARNVTDAARRHRRFPLYLSWAGLFGTGGTQLPPILFAALFGAGAAGLYTLAFRILALPINMLGNAVGNVFLSDAPAAHRSGTLGSLVGSVHDKLAQIAMPPTILVTVAGPELFALAFGDEWRDAGTLARWIAPSLYIMFCDSGLRVFIVTGHEHLSLVMHATQLAVRIAAIVFGALYGGFMLAIALYSVGSGITYAVFIYLQLRTTAVDRIAALRSHARAFLLGLACAAPIVLASFEPPYDVSLVAGLIAFMVLTAARYLMLYRYEY